MSRYFLTLVYALLLLFLHVSGFAVGFNGSRKSGEAKCIESEKQALLSFTQGLGYVSGMPSTWWNDDNNIDCCKWKGIQCNNQTGHIQLLDLRCPDRKYLTGVVNLTSLIHLQHIQHLDLSNNYFEGSHIPEVMGSFTKLRYLNLSYSLFGGRIPSKLGNLSQLQYLDLGRNSFSGEIPFQIGNLKQLQYLDLGKNLLSGVIPFHLMNLTQLQFLNLSQNNISLLSSLYPNFSSLKILDLSYTNLVSLVFQGNFYFGSKLEELHLQNCNLIDRSFLVSSTSTKNSSSSLLYLDLSYNLLKSSVIFHWLFNFTTKLHTLDVSGNMLEGPIPDEFGKVMNSLEYLSLRKNRLQGNISSFFGNMCRLHTLYLTYNKLGGEIPGLIINSSLCNAHLLQTLDLSDNRITGKIPESIGLLSELEYLSLEGNYLEGDVTESHLSNFSKLVDLSISHNPLSLNFASSWVPPFQLSYLSLASCKQGPGFPSWLQSQSSLINLDISDNGLYDSVPNWFWNKLQTIRMLNMSHNNLFGVIPNVPLKLPNLPSIILNSNQFEGNIPSFLRQAQELLLSENKFSDLALLLCEKSIGSNFSTLDLSNNQIKGQIPDCWKFADPLQFLDLSNNNLSGEIPMSMGNLIQLKVLVLRNNSLMGELPSTLKSCSNLIMLDVGENVLSGPISPWIGESMQQLIILIMRGNNFSGNLPSQLCSLRYIQVLDLSRNKLSKGIPTCLHRFTTLSEKSINRNEIQSRIYVYNSTSFENDGTYKISDFKLAITWTWKGTEWEFRDPEYILKSIDLSCNNLTGEIPKEIRFLIGLVALNLSRNNLSGEILSEIGNLTSLDFLDLSRNHFSGRIPSSLDQIDFLGKLDLSHNSLSGRIPLGRHLETFDATSFEGNIDLCGEQLNKTCPGDGDQTTLRHQEATVHGEDSVFYEALYISLGVGYFVGFWGLIGPMLIWQSWRIAYLRFLNRFTNYLTEFCI